MLRRNVWLACFARLASLLACLSLTSCTPEPAPPAPRRVLLIGWDGASFDLIDPLLDQGRLPRLAELLARGSSSRLASTVIPISSAAWASAVTGKGPGKTGLYGFFEPVPGSYDVRLVSSHSLRAAPLWRLLSARGRRVHVMGVPVTYPPEPVRGTLVAGMLSPFDAVYAQPPELTDALRRRGFVPDLGVWRERQPLSWERVERQLRIKEEVMRELLAEDDWSFAMVVFKCLDVVSHRMYDGETEGGVARLLERLDGVLGRLVATAGPDTNVVLMSDHGFASYPRAFNLHRWLLEAGYSVPGEASAAVVPASGALADARRQEHAARLASLDLSRTRAFATVAEGNFGTLRLNLRGREPRGAVPPADAEALLSEIEAALRRLPSPVPGRPLVTHVWRGPALYPGPESDRLPDLLFETVQDVRVVADARLPSFVAYTTPVPEHARTGILVLAGPDVAWRSERGAAEVQDVAPTVLHLLGEPVPREMDGRVQGRLLSLARAPRFVDAPEPERPRSGDVPPPGESVRERLEALGYVE